MFRQMKDDSDITMPKLSHQEALWEIIYQQEQLRISQEDVVSLKKQIEKLTIDSMEPQKPVKHLREMISSTLVNAIPFQTFDRHGIYATDDSHGKPGRVDMAGPSAGLQAALLNHFGKYISEQYNTDPKGGLFSKALRAKSEKGNMTDQHFQTGIYRHIPQIGTEYQLFFRDPSPDDIEDHYLYKIKINTFFEQPQSFSVEYINSVSRTVNIIVPLRGRLQIFESFLLNLVEIKASADFNLHLTVVFFGTQGLEDVHLLINKAKGLGLRNIHFVHIPHAEYFDRGAGIQKGIESWKGGNDIIFVCDTDMLIRKDFFERCITFTERGRSVYFPVVFSLFNPDIIDFFNNETTTNRTDNNDFTISRHRGFWRDFGFGMLCAYKSDFFKVGGYRQWNRKTADPFWGYEDVDLHKRFVKHPELNVIRAPDPGIVHKWHPKICPYSLPPHKLKQCQTTMIATEGNFEQLGRLHVKNIFNEFMKANKSLSFSLK